MRNVRKMVIVMCLFISILVFINTPSSRAVNINTRYVAAYDATSDKLLYVKNNTRKADPASLTKMMSAYVAIKKIKNLDKKAVLKQSDINQAIHHGLTISRLKANIQLTYRDLLYYSLFKSSGDCSFALSRLTYKTNKRFVQEMNKEAKKLKMSSTHFTNAQGYNNTAHKSTCNDMIKLMDAIWQNKKLKKIITAKVYRTSLGTKLKNTAQTYNNVCIAAKNGYTEKSQRCLMSFNSISDHLVYFVFMYSTSKNLIKSDQNDLTKFVKFALKNRKTAAKKKSKTSTKKKAKKSTYLTTSIHWIRNKPNKKGKIIGKLPKKCKVKATACKNPSWVEITYCKKKAYISKTHLKKVS